MSVGEPLYETPSIERASGAGNCIPRKYHFRFTVGVPFFPLLKILPEERFSIKLAHHKHLIAVVNCRNCGGGCGGGEY